MRDLANDSPLDPDVLHAALDALPEKYRLPLILHHLQGKTEAQTAGVLGLSTAATSVRLVRGREKLRARLAQMGVTSACVAGVGAALSGQAVAASPAFVAAATQSAAAALAGQTVSASVLAISKGAIHMLFMAKLKLAAMVTAAVVLVGGAGVGTYVLAAGDPSAKPAAPVQEGFRVNGLSFEVLAPAVVLTPEDAKPTPVSLSLKVTNGTDAPVTLNVFDTITIHMNDAAGKELRIDGGRDGTRKVPPVVVEKGKSVTVERNAELKLLDGKPGQYRLIGSDGAGGIWYFDGLKVGTYSLAMVYENSLASPKDAPYWVGKASTKEATVEISDKPSANADLTITNADNGKNVKATIGQEIIVSLTGDRANTGWEVSQPTGTSVKPVKFGGRFGNQDIPSLEFTPAKDATDEAIGTYTFRYKAVAEGQTTLKFEYLTPGGPVPKARKATGKVAEMTVIIDVVTQPAATVRARIIYGTDDKAQKADVEDWIAKSVADAGSPVTGSYTGWIDLSEKEQEIHASMQGGRLIKGRASERQGKFEVEISGFKIGALSRTISLKPGEAMVLKLTDYPPPGNIFIALTALAMQEERPAAGPITQEKAQAIALEAVMAYFKDDPIRQKALRVSVPMKKVEEGGKTYWLVEYFGSNGKAKIATWTQVRVDAQTGEATVRPTPGKVGA